MNIKQAKQEILNTLKAYLAKDNPNIEDLSVPLRVNNCGHYRIHTTPVITTPHPEGRNDYQLLYIAEGKGYFYFKGNLIDILCYKCARAYSKRLTIYKKRCIINGINGLYSL